MATPTETADIESQKNRQAEAKIGFLPLMMALLSAVLLACALMGGAGYYLLRSGRIPLAGAPVATAKMEPPAALLTHDMVLDGLLVNLADEGGHAYLRVGLTIRVADPPAKKGDKTKEEKPKDGKAANPEDAAVRDTVLDVLGRQTATGLLTSDGKERLKQQMKSALAAHHSEIKVVDLFLTDFLVQRQDGVR